MSKGSHCGGRSPERSAASAGSSARRATRRCATSAGCSSRCTAGAASATTCSPSGAAAVVGHRRAARRDRRPPPHALAATCRAASAARRCFADRTSARTAGGRSARMPGARRTSHRGDRARRGGLGRACGRRCRAETRAELAVPRSPAADGTCPRCGARRDDRPALLPRLRAPAARGRAAASRPPPRWMRALGWYPGDWVWARCSALVVAAAGAAAAIADQRATGRQRITAFEAGDGGGPVRRAGRGPDPRSSGRDAGQLPNAARARHRPDRERAPDLAAQRERLDDRARLLPEAERAGGGARDTATQGRAARPQPRSESSTRAASRASSPATSSSSPASTARRPTPTPPPRPPARPASAAPTRARLPAERARVARRAGRALRPTESFHRTENICNSSGDGVESSPGCAANEAFTAS